MEKEFAQAAKINGSDATIHSVFADGAMDALQRGDTQRHNDLVAEVAKTLEDVDAIMLAHFSTARAVSTVRTVTDKPVISSPESAIEKMKACVTQHE